MAAVDVAAVQGRGSWLRGAVAAVMGIFDMVRAAAAVSEAVSAGRRPDPESLRRLGLQILIER